MYKTRWDGLAWIIIMIGLPTLIFIWVFPGSPITNLHKKQYEINLWNATQCRVISIDRIGFESYNWTFYDINRPYMNNSFHVWLFTFDYSSKQSLPFDTRCYHNNNNIYTIKIKSITTNIVNLTIGSIILLMGSVSVIYLLYRAIIIYVEKNQHVYRQVISNTQPA